jgi:hypothetical protein
MPKTKIHIASAWLNDRIGRWANLILFAGVLDRHRHRLHAYPGERQPLRIPARLFRLQDFLRCELPPASAGASGASLEQRTRVSHGTSLSKGPKCTI